MFPYIKVFNKIITSYTILVIIGILVVGFLCIKRCKKYNIDDNNMIVFLLITSIGMIIGGHLLYGIVNYKLIIDLISNINKITSFSMLLNDLHIIFGGSVFYGGLIGGLIAGFIYAKIKKIDIKLYSFVITPFIPLFHFFGRIGCFLYGCCYGIESKIGFTYTHSPIEIANGVKRFPVQLLEAGLNLGIFIFLLILQKKNKCKNNILIIYLMMYSFIRFFLEFFRGDFYRGFLFGLSTSQIISIIIFIISIIYLIFSKKQSNLKD